MKSKIAIIAAITLAVSVSASAGDCYSDGIRVGTIQKFSNKGVINKSWEGELVMEGTKISGGSSSVKGGNVWKFSVLDATVAKVIDEATMLGSPIALKYCQVAFQVGQSDTNYRITQAVIRK